MQIFSYRPALFKEKAGLHTQNNQELYDGYKTYQSTSILMFYRGIRRNMKLGNTRYPMEKQTQIEEYLESQHVKNVNQVHVEQMRFGERMADRIAEIAGSWKFIFGFIAVLILWIIANVWFLANEAFDPYPFILLNLCLSCIAALQAPIIMMSQNRQEAKDRIRSENDFLVDQKAEVLIEELYYKITNIEQQLAELMDAQAIKSVKEQNQAK